MLFRKILLILLLGDSFSLSAATAFLEVKSSKVLEKISNTKEVSELPKTFNLLVWNILTGHKKKWQSVFQEYVKDHQLILIQETYLTKEQKKIYRDSGISWDFANAYLYAKDNIMSGVGTGSLAKSIRSSYLFSKYKEPIMNVKKVTLFSLYNIVGSRFPILVVNVHAINFVFDHIYFEQLANIEIALRKHRGPIIIAGDFNTFNLPKLKFVRLLAEKHDLKEVSFEIDRRKTFNSYPLDHVFIRGFEVKKAIVLDSSTASDHNAMSVTLELKNGK